MPEQPDEPAENDLLLAFSTEPGGKPPESTQSLAARVECLERALHRSSSEIESLKSELATLVGTVDDIGKNARRPPRGRRASAPAHDRASSLQPSASFSASPRSVRMGAVVARFDRYVIRSTRPLPRPSLRPKRLPVELPPLHRSPWPRLPLPQRRTR